VRCVLDFNGDSFARMVVYRLQGDSLWAHNDGDNPYNVALHRSDEVFRSSITVAPHSVTFLELLRDLPSGMQHQPNSELPTFKLIPLNSKGAYQVRMTLMKPARVSIEVWDLLGRCVQRSAWKEFPAGSHSFPIFVSPNAPGHYWGVLRTERAIVVQPTLLR